MNSTNRKPPAAPHAPHAKPVVVQLKTGVSAQSVKQPVAPPVYRPQPAPQVMQRKLANVAANAEPQAVRSSQPSPRLLTPAVSPFRSVVQRAAVGRRRGGGGGRRPPGGGKPPVPDHYAEASLKMAKYGMSEDYQKWLILGKKLGYPAPNLSGVHASKPGKGGGKAEKERHKQISAIMDAWKEGLFIHLVATRGIHEQRLGRISRALETKK